MFDAHIDQARVNLQFDIGFGDSVFPAAEFMDYPSLLGTEKPHIKVYPQYTVIAEKFEAMVSLGMKNSRLKDFFDIWLLSECFDFDFTILKQAIERTFTRRKTHIPTEFPVALTDEFTRDEIKLSQWQTFLRKVAPKQSPDTFQAATERIRVFLSPLIVPVYPEPTRWKASAGWQ